MEKLDARRGRCFNRESSMPQQTVGSPPTWKSTSHECESYTKEACNHCVCTAAFPCIYSMFRVFAFHCMYCSGTRRPSFRYLAVSTVTFALSRLGKTLHLTSPILNPVPSGFPKANRSRPFVFIYHIFLILYTMFS